VAADTAEEGQEGLRPAAKIGLVAGGAALAKEISEEHHEKAEAEAGPTVAELNEQLEAQKKQYAALQADLQTETKSKADLATEIQARVAELEGLKGQIAEATAGVDDMLGPMLKPADGAEGDQPFMPQDLKEKLSLLKTKVANLSAKRAELLAKLQAGDLDLGVVKKKLVNVDALLSGILGVVPADDTASVMDGVNAELKTGG
jgi:DNA repair exonuclease SbcCD ATPase subunit